MSVIDPSRSVLVYLANGVQGGAVIRAALRRGFKVRALVRDMSRCQALVALGVEAVAGDLDDRASLVAASSGVGHAVIQIPIGTMDTMRRQAGNVLAASTETGHRSIVLKLASASRPVPCPEPSFLANAAIEQLVRSAGLPFAVVRPTMYLDNLLKPSARADIVRHGVFAPPIAEAQRIAWTSADDCADVAVALLERGADGGDYLVAGPESVTGDELAERISAGLGRRIVYRAQAIDAFEREIDDAMGAGNGRRIASKFRFFAEQPAEANAILSRLSGRLSRLDGFRPTSIEDWARRHRGDFLETDDLH